LSTLPSFGGFRSTAAGVVQACKDIDMARVSRRYAPLVYGILQAAVTTAVATAIATSQLTDLGLVFLERWVVAWLLAWLAMLPLVILVSPLIARAVAALTSADGAQPGKR
jgi:hypothetical protein